MKSFLEGFAAGTSVIVLVLGLCVMWRTYVILHLAELALKKYLGN